MTMEPKDKRPGEIDRLQAENLALNEQIKLLVQTEQRLARSQADIDRQITRIRALSEFSLEMAVVHDENLIFERAAELLMEWFDIERIALIALDANENLPVLRVRDCRARRIETSEEEGLAKELRVSFGRMGSAEFMDGPWHPKLREAMAIEDDGSMVVLPVRSQDGKVLKILAITRAQPRISAYRGALDERSLPVLQLLGVHVERAIQNAILNTDLEERTGELLQARKMEAIGRLAGGVAHDFNNIITIILGHAELLKTQLATLDEDTSSPESILQAAERATRMTSQLLAFGRRQPQRLEPVDLSELARGMSGFFRDVIGEHIRLTCALDSGDCFVLADRSHLEQILLNLVVNSRDAIETSGEILIAVVREVNPEDGRPMVKLTVTDTGIGMNEAARERVFEPFFTTKAEGKGSGLGLSIVYGLVRQADGSIELESSVGEGTEVQISLPWTDRRPESQEALEAGNASFSPGVLTILLVEDEIGIRKLAARTLQDAGYRVLTAADGREALELVGHDVGAIDLLVSDVVMPRMGGPDLLRTLRKKKPDLPALFMSGYSFENMKGRDVADSPFLRKPFRPLELRREVAKLCPAPGNTTN